MTTTLPTGERRFREGSGKRYTSAGNVRCQAVAKSRLRRWREEHNDYDSPAEAAWPECQCHRPATAGMFVCQWHGGLTPSSTAPRSLFDVLPIDLGEKLKVLMENPDYISRREDMLLLKARQWEILEELQQQVGGEEAWGLVQEAHVAISRGDIIQGLRQLDDALQSTKLKKEAWNEWYRAEAMLRDLTSTEVKTAKELQMMATADQVAVLISNIFDAITRGVEKYVEQPVAKVGFLNYVAAEIGRFANISPISIGFQLDEGSHKDDRKTK